tara:strand:+ start:2746 stop:3663 length:918 start_codon:yes stop_codon:yes gene_type:complete
MANCNGWGLEQWGLGPWGNGEDHPPQIVNISPVCGSTKVNPCANLVIKVGSVGCATLDIDCVRITVNGTLVYDGTGLTFGVDQDTGYSAPCDNASTVTTEASAIFNEVWVFNVNCDCYTCGTTVNWSAIFCTTQGQTLNVSCSFELAPCFYISSVEIIDRSHYLLRFSNPVNGDAIINSTLYDPNSYTVTSVDVGVISGRTSRVRDVLVDQSLTPSHVIVEVDKTTDGAGYLFSGAATITDIYGQTLSERGQGIAFARKTKVDTLLAKLPTTYNKKVSTRTGNVISPFHLAAALSIEDERSSGNS